MTPMTSMLPPLLACIAIFSRASADIRTLHEEAGGEGGQQPSGWAAAASAGGASDRGRKAPDPTPRSAPLAPPHRLK